MPGTALDSGNIVWNKVTKLLPSGSLISIDSVRKAGDIYSKQKIHKMSGMLDGVNAREINKTREEERGV